MAIALSFPSHCLACVFGAGSVQKHCRALPRLLVLVLLALLVRVVILVGLCYRLQNHLLLSYRTPATFERWFVPLPFVH